MFNEGDKVKWKWGQGYGHGVVQSRFEKTITRKIDDEEVTRHGSKDNPAYYVNVKEGNNVVKLHSELEKDD